jgi:hypothetical protein
MSSTSTGRDEGSGRRWGLYVVVTLVAAIILVGTWRLGFDGDDGATAPRPDGAALVAAAEAGAAAGDGDGGAVESGDAGAPAARDASAGGEAGADGGEISGDSGPTPPRPRTERARPPGYVNILSIPNAEVWDGRRRLGTTPLRRVELSAGRHALKLRSVSGDAEKRVVVRIRSDEVIAVSVRLDE